MVADLTSIVPAVARCVAKRREIVHDIQRYLAKQQYYVQIGSQIYMGVWIPALRNYGPNLGYDYGGRLMAAWLER